MDAEVEPVIAPLDPADETIARITEIERVYIAPDGSVVTHYKSHEKNCVLTRVLPKAIHEVCVLKKDDIPNGFSIGDGSFPVGDKTENVQFDSTGNIYVILTGLSAQCAGKPTTNPKGLNTEALLMIKDGETRFFLGTDRCATYLFSWSPLNSGGVLFTFMPQKDGEKHRLVRWLPEKGQEEVLFDDLVLEVNGMQRTQDRKILLFVAQSGPDVFPGASSGGGILLYDENSGNTSPWYHYSAQQPTYAHESAIAGICSCEGLFKSNLTTGGTSIVGLGSVYDPSSIVYGPSGTRISGPLAKTLIWELFPRVAPLQEVPTEWLREFNSRGAEPNHQRLLASSTKLAAIANFGQVFLGFDKFEYRESLLGLINLETGERKVLVDPSQRYSILSISPGPTTDTFLTQALRLEDDKYVLGTFDGLSKEVTWSDSETPRFKWMASISLQVTQSAKDLKNLKSTDKGPLPN